MLTINGQLYGGGTAADAPAPTTFDPVAFAQSYAAGYVPSPTAGVDLRTAKSTSPVAIMPGATLKTDTMAPLPTGTTPIPSPVGGNASRRGTDKGFRSEFIRANSLPAALEATGYITTFDRGVWRVARPRVGGVSGVGVASLGGACLVGSCSLGEAPYEELPSSSTKPPVATEVSKKDFENRTGTRPWYKKPSVWAMIGGGAAVLGGGYWLVRR